MLAFRMGFPRWLPARAFHTGFPRWISAQDFHVGFPHWLSTQCAEFSTWRAIYPLIHNFRHASPPRATNRIAFRHGYYYPHHRP